MEMESLKILTGRQIILQQSPYFKNVRELDEVEFSVFSQLGDDGIIQYLINRVNIRNRFFVEFGVQNYIESNTRFLLMNNNWQGLIMDGSQEFIDFIKNDYYYWKYNVEARRLFITAENINQAFRDSGVAGEIGILHIDIDGNDYWIWKAITEIDPVIVIMEYNSCFGDVRAITVPYEPDFERYAFHASGLVFGASLSALCDLANEKGYAFVGSNSYGNNAYFVKRTHLNGLKEINSSDGYRKSYCRQNKDANGNFTFKPDFEVITQIKDAVVINTRTGQQENIN
jgi:hypothetical protein